MPPASDPVAPTPKLHRPEQPLRWLVALLIAALCLIGLGLLHWRDEQRDAAAPSLVSGRGGFEAEYLPDPSGRLGLSDVLSRPEGFLPMTSGEIFIPCVWYRLSIPNDSDEVRRAVLAPEDDFLQDVTLYRRGPQGWEAQRDGATVVWSRRPLRSYRPAFPIALPAHGRTVVYLRIRNSLRQPKAFAVWNDASGFQHLLNLWGYEHVGFFAVWIALMAYNGFLYAILRRRDYLLYCLYVLSMGALAAVGSDLTTIWWPWPHWALRAALITLLFNLTTLVLLKFSQAFLATREHAPQLDRLLHGLAVAVGLLCLAVPAWLYPPYVPHYEAVEFVFIILVLAFLPIVGLVLALRRVPQAGLYALAFLPFIAGAITTLNSYLVQPETRPGAMAAFCGGALQLILFALALAARYRQMGDEAYLLRLDYTSRLESEVTRQTRELRDANVSLARANRDKNRVFGIIGHDLRGPAHQLLSLSQMLAAGPKAHSAQELSELAAEIEETCKAQVDLLDNLVQWSRALQDASHPTPELQSAEALVEATLERLRSTAEAKGVSLGAEVDPQLEVRADTQAALAILRNLLGNALKFTPAGGRVVVTARKRGGRVEFSVRDTGVGMSSTELNSLFVGPVQSRTGVRSEKGAGVGLMLCRDLAQANGGDLRMESTLGSGTTATLALPSGAEAP